MDGGASILIGIVLLTVAIFLARESKGLLLGESAGEEVLNAVDKILKKHKNVENWNLPQTIHFGPNNILMTIEIDLIAGLDIIESQKTIAELRQEIQDSQPKVNKLYIHSIELEEQAIQNPEGETK